MPSVCRIMEIVVYSFLNFFPYLLLALYPFRNRLRFSPRITAALTVLAVLMQIAVGVKVALFPSDDTGILSAFSTAVFFLFYFLAVREHPGKTLFTLLMLSNIANFVVVSSKCAEGMLFPELARQQYRWSFSAVMLAIQLVLLVPMFFYMKRVYTEVMEKEANRSVWGYLWLIPATFYLNWFYQLYNSERSSLEIALQPGHAVFLLFVNLGAFLVYFIVTRLIGEYDKNIRLERQNHMLSLEKLQYENLRERMAETRQARHDLRHHIAVMKGYLADGRLRELTEYLKGYQGSLPEDSVLVYCKNDTVNYLLLYFARQAGDKGIDFSVHADLPEKLGIEESDLTVVLGNLLENAIDACAAQKGGRREIVFRGRIEGDALLLTVDNTFDGELRRDRNGNLLSTKRRGEGLGMKSVEHIAARRGGTLRAEQRDGIFYASVLLRL